MTSSHVIALFCLGLSVVASLGLIGLLGLPPRYEVVKIYDGEVYVVDDNVSWDDCVGMVDRLGRGTYCRYQPR